MLVFSIFNTVIFHRIFKSSSQNIVMSNANYNKNHIQFGRTIGSNIDINSTTLAIHRKLAEELGIENCKVVMTIMHDFDGSKHLLVSKYHREIIMN